MPALNITNTYLVDQSTKTNVTLERKGTTRNPSLIEPILNFGKALDG
jgi:hypothetical protein